MEHVYALGVSIIEFIQDNFQDYDGYFEVINEMSNPNHALDILFPFLSIVDSVFASQLLLCTAFGGWLNAVLKWWLLEDRPYWWVRETDLYCGGRRPQLRQSPQSCETGPGCPSGHSENAAIVIMLSVYAIHHIITDRKLHVTWWKYVWYPLCAVFLISVMLARMYVATHFPHQVLAGTLLGAFLAPFLCIYVNDPFVWQYGPHAKLSVARTVMWHCASALTTMLIGVVTYFSLTWCGFDPGWSVKLANRWCEDERYIHQNTTPMYALVYSTGHLMGWALSVTPAIAKYRHNTKPRSIRRATLIAVSFAYSFHNLKKLLDKDSDIFYPALFLLSAFRVFIFLRLLPFLSLPLEIPGEFRRKSTSKKHKTK